MNINDDLSKKLKIKKGVFFAFIKKLLRYLTHVEEKSADDEVETGGESSKEKGCIFKIDSCSFFNTLSQKLENNCNVELNESKDENLAYEHTFVDYIE